MGDQKRKVVITGLGAITALGLNVNETWDGLVKGRSGIRPITVFDASQCRTRIAAEVPKEFETVHSGVIPKRYAKQMTRLGKFAFISAREALNDAKINDDVNKDRVDVIVGAAGSGYSSLDARENYIIKAMINSISSWISIYHEFKGPNFTVNAACASSAYAIVLAYDRIMMGYSDIVVTGGTESMVYPEGVNGFNELLALSENNEALDKASRPFDADRDGFVMGEGAGVLILESLESALKRGARIYGELAGYGMISEAYNIVAPEKDGEGMAKTMQLALENSRAKPDEIDYINAHGTSTFLNDIYETKAIKKVFGDRARQIPISSTKSMIGHTLGAAGVLECLVTVKSISEKIIPPTINYRQPDPECDLDYVPNEARPCDIKTALSNSFGFGGHNCALVLKKHQI